MDKKRSFFSSLIRKDVFKTLITSVACALAGLLVGFIVLLIVSPEAALEGFKTLSLGFLAVPNKYGLQAETLAKTLARTAPLIVSGVAILLAYKAGFFNIGASGQFTMGVFAALYMALVWHLPWYLCMLGAIIFGAAYGAIVGVLKAFLNVNEVISGIMLNWIGLYLTSLIIKSTPQMWDSIKYETLPIKRVSPGSVIPSLGLEKLFNNYEYITIAIFIAIAVAIAVYIILEKTTIGYKMKATGFNKNAAKYAGMNEKVNTIVILAFSGALAGLSGALLYLTGIENWYCPTNVPSMGFDGISAAFLGGLSPIGSIISSFFITHISVGGSRLDTSFYSPEIAKVVTGVIIYLCAFVLFIKDRLDKRILKKDREMLLANALQESGTVTDTGGAPPKTQTDTDPEPSSGVTMPETGGGPEPPPDSENDGKEAEA
ncbi:MAG: ABC transporter permease [Clostridia bacterium]|nr:ABC transporter permease [Clostridia bacterium]